MITMKNNTKQEIIEAYNSLLEDELQMGRINAFLERNGLKIGDLKRLLEITLGEDKND